MIGDRRSGYCRGEVITLDDTKTRIIVAAIKAVRQYGLEGVRIQNVSELAGISAGAIYRHFDGRINCLQNVLPM